MTTPPGRGDGATRHCRNCGSALAPGAAYCRTCGVKHAKAAPTPAAEATSGSSRTAFWIGAVIVLIGAGAAIAILLARGGDTSRTTVLIDSADATTTATIEAERTESAVDSPVLKTTPDSEVDTGLYIQAGSFRTLAGAKEERERLATAGIAVQIISSDGAAELYPGFKVLFGGPIENTAQEHSLLKALQENGVDGFARELSPAPPLVGASEAAGRWTGTLDRSSGERPNLNDHLPATVEIDPSGATGTLKTAGGCSETLMLEKEGPLTLTYSQDTSCVSGGDVYVRPTGDELMVAMLPLGTDVFVTGGLSPS